MRYRKVVQLLVTLLLVSNAFLIYEQPQAAAARVPGEHLLTATLPPKGGNPKLDSMLNRLIETSDGNLIQASVRSGPSFGLENSFTTLDPLSVTTNNATNITLYSAQLNGELNFLGSATSANISFLWGSSSLVYTETPLQAINSTGNFSFILTGLSSNTTYHFRAKAVGDGTFYGDDLTFSTLTLTPSAKIAFVSDVTGSREIYMINPDGSNRTRLTYDYANNAYPAVSPDSIRIAYMSTQDGGGGEIYIMNADGTAQTRLFTAWGAWPAWSPDGSKIAFTSNLGSSLGIWVMNANGSNQTRLTPDGIYATSPTWSPDGTKIAYEHYVGSYGISVMNADGSGQHALTNPDGSQYPPSNLYGDKNPAWSPDGSKIAFSSTRSGTTQIYTMDPDGGNQIRVTDVEADMPTWSPDSSRIAFNNPDIGNPDIGYIWIMNIDGTNQVQLTEGFEPSWSGDGTVVIPPTVTTDNANNITTTSTRLNGNLTSLGSAPSANVSFEWGTTSGSLTQRTANHMMDSTGNFSINLTGLSATTTYYFRAKAVGDGTTYGVEKTFTTATSSGITVNLSAALQGGSRPDAGWIIPLTVKFFTPGANILTATPVYQSTVTTTKSGTTAVASVTGVTAGNYDVTAVSSHTLVNVKLNVAIAGSGTNLNMGTLLEGNANHDGIINMLDFSTLAASFGKSSGNAGYDPRADFDRSGQVNMLDFSLLASNFGKTAPVSVP